ncbi:MAG TPA: hypothetical protein DIT99_21180 [Candidatus Latescibacteria bacterium]|nr:hypothetical protein [Candidatus Latescibacterota bacterium]
MKKVYMQLQESEGHLLGAASRIYAAYLRTDQYTPGDEASLMSRAIQEAIQLAQTIDHFVIADDEVD